MKKHIVMLLAVLTLCAIFCITSPTADAATEGGYTYSVKSADEIPDFSSFESDEDELRDSFQFEDEDGNVIEDEEEFDAFDDGSDEF